MICSRRSLLGGAAATGLATGLVTSVGPNSAHESYWNTVAAQYDVTREIVQLENGNWGIMARPCSPRTSATLEP